MFKLSEIIVGICLSAAVFVGFHLPASVQYFQLAHGRTLYQHDQIDEAVSERKDTDSRLSKLNAATLLAYHAPDDQQKLQQAKVLVQDALKRFPTHPHLIHNAAVIQQLIDRTNPVTAAKLSDAEVQALETAKKESPTPDENSDGELSFTQLFGSQTLLSTGDQKDR